ncbi:MAG TPA: hypothetical protein VII48_00925 [Rhizomicrobium sp.]
MEFSYGITEQEYRQAFKLRTKIGSKGRRLKAVMFWVFILVCLLLIWTVVQKALQPSEIQPVLVVADSPGVFSNIWPFGLIVGIVIFLRFGLLPIRLRQMYRKDPSMQGQFTAKVTATSFSLANTAGMSSQAGWNYYEDWREANGVVALICKNGSYQPLSLANLSEPVRAELRGILASALPKK